MTDSVDLFSEESWLLAGRYTALVTAMPPRLHQTYKTLRRVYIQSIDRQEEFDIDQALASVSTNYNATLGPVDQLTSLKAPLYFAADRLFPDRFGRTDDDTSRALLHIFGPGLFSTFYIAVWFLRRIKKHAAPELWEEFSYDCMAATEIGYRIGAQIPALGAVDGALIAMLRHAAVGTFYMKGSELYRRYRNLHKGRLHLGYEHDRWGCDHGQVATLLLQHLGFKQPEISGIARWNPIDVVAALRGQLHDLSENCDARVRRWGICSAYLNSIWEEVDRGDLLEAENFPASETAHFYSKCRYIIDGEGTFTWMLK